MSTVCGTPQYVAPEVIQGTAHTVYGPEVGFKMVQVGALLSFLSASGSSFCFGSMLRRPNKHGGVHGSTSS